MGVLVGRAARGADGGLAADRQAALGDRLDHAGRGDRRGLCYGWIDGQRRAHDDVSFLQRFSRRRPGSSWSKVNVAKVEALMAAGRWEAAYESQRNAAVPPDLAAALAGNARANAAFERLGRSDRYAVILPLLKARTPKTRARILARAVAQLAAQK